ncbi:transcriptional regulator, TetR family [Cryptosporangium aurantiacum]|uniref:Transcriptional regulator, TetR family n=1 Tax=Cryptosporangium aurantiacum TaxID=134849 RepID=A0A1M7L2N9_9ACTN|nr:transcriptional regulator, TetR family [Cryptosporangium aurantiacum]
MDALETRAAILRTAADVASVEGLEGLSIGRLATELSMSKSGVLGQFGSKEELQLETVRLVLANFRARVWEPAQHLEHGLPRLLGICDAWTRYAMDPGYPGGCCVATFTFEFDGRPGRVRDELARGLRQWRSTLVGEITAAIEAGDLSAALEPSQAAFSLDAIASGVGPARMLHGDVDAGTWAVRAMRTVLRAP